MPSIQSWIDPGRPSQTRRLVHDVGGDLVAPALEVSSPNTHRVLENGLPDDAALPQGELPRLGDALLEGQLLVVDDLGLLEEDLPFRPLGQLLGRELRLERAEEEGNDDGAKTEDLPGAHALLPFPLPA